MTTTKTPTRKPAPAKKIATFARYEPHDLRLRMYIARVDEDRPEADYDKAQQATLPTPEQPANVVSSLCIDGKHRLVIDLDVPAHLEPSTTPGNSHLYIDVPMEWKDYEHLLMMLSRVGIIEPGYWRASAKRGQTFVRLPGVVKPAGQMKSPFRPLEPIW